MLILLSQNEQGISALDLQKHIFPSGSSSMKSTFPWMQCHYVNYYKGEQLYETNRRETALTHPRGFMFDFQVCIPVFVTANNIT